MSAANARPTLAVRPIMKTEHSQGDVRTSVSASVTSLGTAEAPIDIPTMNDVIESVEGTARSTRPEAEKQSSEISIVRDANRKNDELSGLRVRNPAANFQS